MNMELGSEFMERSLYYIFTKSEKGEGKGAKWK